MTDDILILLVTEQIWLWTSEVILSREGFLY